MGTSIVYWGYRFLSHGLHKAVKVCVSWTKLREIGAMAWIPPTGRHLRGFRV